MAAVAARRQEGVVVLEDLHDPHNAAAIFRTCEGFGIHKVILIFEQEKPWNPRRVGKASSSSANKWLEFQVFRSTDTALKTLRKRGYRLYATTLGQGATPLAQVKFTKPKTAIVFGNEYRGISETAAQLSHEKIFLPMQGFVQSFNISVSAAIFLYEQFRQRARRGLGRYVLSARARNGINRQWSSR